MPYGRDSCFAWNPCHIFLNKRGTYGIPSLSVIFFNYLKVQIIKFNLFNKIILIETGSRMTDKFFFILLQPHGFLQIEFIAGLFQTVIYLGGS